MKFSAEPSSSISFTSNSQPSNGSISFKNSSPPSALEPGQDLDINSLNKLSSSLEQLLVDSGSSYSDAVIMVENVPVGVHRCILATRSRFFDKLFRKEKETSEKEEKPKYLMSEMLPYGRVGYESFIIFLSYLYTGKLKPFPLEVSMCVDSQCAHDACRPAIEFVVELMYASSVFQVPELASIFQGRLQHFVGKALVEDVLSILRVAFDCEANQLVSSCVERIARSDLETISIEKELPFEIAENIKLLRSNSQDNNETNELHSDPFYQKRVKRIHKAFDSDDVELIKLLLSESNITLDEAYALHYAAAYCDTQVVTKVLDLGYGDVNLQTNRGYTVLHIAAMRKEPSIILSLLTKGARAAEMTLDGWSAVRICRRLTRPKEYNMKIVQGQMTNKDRICIDVLEREMWRNPMAGDVSMSSPLIADDLHMKLLYLENRVAFARLLFPAEAKLAMESAQTATTVAYHGRLASISSTGKLREVDLNETPIMQNKRLHARMEALSKTGSGKQHRHQRRNWRGVGVFFPHCAQVLDNLVDEDLPDLFYLEKGTPEEQTIKRTRFMELKNDVLKAFSKDKAELQRSGFSSASSTASLAHSGNNKVRKL